jgi:serine/threonine protein kinase
MAELAPGISIKQYRLEQLLGRGASGEVWRATDGSKIVAIKFMNEALMQSQSVAKHRQRMEREIKSLSMLNHPNITSLYDYDLAYMPPYMVMEYVDSMSYEQLISQGEMLRIPVTIRLEMLEKLASALTTAHDAGIIHRDIKPGNMNGVEHPYLLDFSIALEEANVEHTNFNIGTTMYMTPDEEPPDRLSDNFSFGIVAYEVLFGRHPIFAADDPTRTMGAYTRLQAYQRLKNRDWRFPSRIPKVDMPLDMLGADLTRLDAVFERSMSARNIRYVNLGEFVADLKAAILIPANQPYIQQLQAAANPMTDNQEVAALPLDANYAQAEAQRLAEVKSTREEAALSKADTASKKPANWNAYSTLEAAAVDPKSLPHRPKPPSGGLVARLKKLLGLK